MTEITDPEKILSRQMATAERLHLIADAIAEGVFKNFDIAVREDKRTALLDKRGRNFEGAASAVTVSFVLREGAQLFYEDQKKRKADLEEMIAAMALDSSTVGADHEAEFIEGPRVQPQSLLYCVDITDPPLPTGEYCGDDGEDEDGT